MPGVPVHYLWVGPKPEDHKKGMDTIGPDLMKSKYPDQPVHFWCLESEVDKYQTHFHAKHGPAKIEVHAIEPFVKERDPKFYAFIERLKRRAATFKQLEEPRHEIQEMITIKTAFAYFIQQYKHGAVLDTNVSPDETVSPDIPVFQGLSQFTAPWYFHDEANRSLPDPWFMFAIQDDPNAKIRFQGYFKDVSALFALLVNEKKEEVPQETYIPSERKLVRPHVASAFIHWAKDSEKAILKKNGLKKYQVAGIEKVYFNTHRADTVNCLRHPILNLLKSGAHQQVVYMLNENHIDPFTPLPFANRNKQFQLVPMKRSIIDTLIEERQETIDHQQESKEKILNVPQKLEDKIKHLRVYSAKAQSSMQVAKPFSAPTGLSLDLSGTLFDKRARYIKEKASQSAPSQSKPIDHQKRLEANIRLAERESASQLKDLESSIEKDAKKINALNETIGWYASMSDAPNALTVLLRLPEPAIALTRFLEEKIKQFSVGQTESLFLETFNALQVHLYEHLVLARPKPSISSIEELVRGLFIAPNAKTTLDLVNALLTHGPITGDSKEQYIALFETLLADKSSESPPQFFPSELKTPYNAVKTNAFLDATIKQLSPLGTPRV